ncbi:MAG: thrombospondin type 3 repeat-containing protein, partial [Caldilineaceae bacterium]|nr:thrombospondin type 3 repeat-containing protein [Caldilineaceae bacterium]
PASWLTALRPSTATFQQWTANLLLCLAAALIITLMLLARRSRWTYGTMAVLVILAQVAGPLLQAERLQAASDRLAARYGAATVGADVAVDAAEGVAVDDQAATLAPGDTHMAALRAAATDFTAKHGSTAKNVSRPLAAGQPAPATAPQVQSSGDVTDSDGDGVPDAVELAEGLDPNDPDSDDDTLTDGHEYYRLGTDPLSDDSDSDGLADAKEVAGFLINSQRYYTDPLDPDTNRDGLLDGIEWYGQSLLAETVSDCEDSDNDGFPDIVDEDNDNDLVPDGVDLSPFSQRGQAAPYNKNNPFTFRADGLQANKPLYVNLQLRPTTPGHLTYALNVLDWPANDTRGNIQRYLDTTWATTNNEALRADDAQATNGDLRVIPLLSIRIPKQVDNFGNLPVKTDAPPLTATSTITDWYNAIDQDKLTPYSMNILKADENTLEVTAPLMMESDTTGGGRVAFGAHLYYESGVADSWGSDHEVRVIWLVQMITDVCNDEQQLGTAFCDDPANRHDEQTI